MYTEEVDLCFRIKKQGLRVFYLPEWDIVHLGGASSTKEFSILSEYKSMKIFYKKNMPSWQFPFLRLFLKSGALIRATLFRILEGKEAYEVYIKAYKNT
jgi:GT2 family glycosyltransferase